MNRDFSGITVRRLSRQNSLKRSHSKKRFILEERRLKTSQSRTKNTKFIHTSISHSTSISNTTKTKNNSRKQNTINDEGQKNRSSASTEKELNQSNLSDYTRDFLPINSITNSTTCFDLSITHRSLSRNHRISPINCQSLVNDGFTLDVFERNRKKKKNQKKSYGTLWKIIICIIVFLLLIGGIIGILIYALNQSKMTTALSSQAATASSITPSQMSSTTTTTPNSACTTSGITCPTPMFAWNRTNNCTKPAATYLYYSCCYLAISAQLTIEFILREDVSNWYIDDVSVRQGSSELLINGGFEANLTGWIATSSIGNLSATPVALYLPGAAHSGTTYLHSEGRSTSDHIKQTVNVTQGQYVNVSFWWLDEGGVPGGSELCEAFVTLTP